METIIVTGGAGFIGANFVRFALEHTDARIVVVDKLTYAGHICNLDDVLQNSRIVFIEADIADRPKIEQIFRSHHPNGLLNFAAETHVDRSIDDPEPFIRTNLVGVFVLLETARQYLRGLPQDQRDHFRFLHVSTDEVYGSLSETGRFSETTPYAPNSPYAASKAGADYLVRAYYQTYGVPTLVTNCSNNYGPYQFPEKLLPLVLLNAFEGKPIPIYGDGGNIRDWLYVTDHCAGLWHVLKHGVVGEKYNIGGGNERTNLEMVDCICSLLEQICPPHLNRALVHQGIQHYRDLKTFVPDRPGHDYRYAINGAKLQRELGWVAQYDLESGLEQTVRWYVSNLDWCRKVLDRGYNRERLGLDQMPEGGTEVKIG